MQRSGKTPKLLMKHAPSTLQDAPPLKARQSQYPKIETHTKSIDQK